MFFTLFDQDQARNTFEVAIPGLASWFVTYEFDGELREVKELAADDRLSLWSSVVSG